MTARDSTTSDLTQQRIRIAEDVVFWPVHERGELSYRLEIPSLHRFFRVGYEEYLLISLLDGRSTISQACGLVATECGRRAPSGKQAEAIQRWLLKNELAYLPSQGPPDRNKRSTASRDLPTNHRPPALDFLRRLNPFWIKLSSSRASRIIQRLALNLSWCFSKTSVICSTVIILFAAALLIGHWDPFANDSLEVFSPSNFVWLLVTWVALKIVHETAHAIACHRQGGEVQDAGIVLVLFAPMAYVDVTSCWRMDSRWSRLAVSGAGMFAELLIAAVALIAWCWSPSPEIAVIAKNTAITASLTTVLFNANVLMRFDGYYMLADAIDVTNLYEESMNSVKRTANRFITGFEESEGSLTGWRRPFVFAYGCAALIWKIVICFTLGVAASTLFSGAGIILSVLGVVLWFAAPSKKLITYANQLWQTDRFVFARASTISLSMAALLIVSIVWLPIPTAVTVAGVAEYTPETIVRSGVDGFVRRINVNNMSKVRTGDVLMVLENRELDDRQRSLELELAQIEIRKRQAANDRDPAAVLILEESSRALTQQLEQISFQRQGLSVVAHRNGQVVSRGLASMIGSYVKEGDQLLHIAQPHEKEIIAVVSQQNIRRSRRATRDTVRLSAADRSLRSGTLERIDPRATSELPFPSLAATAGGPLSVQRDDSDQSQLRLLEPHFVARISLDQESAASTPAGMRMQAALGYRTDPLLGRLRVAMLNLFYQAHDQP